MTSPRVSPIIDATSTPKTSDHEKERPGSGFLPYWHYPRLPWPLPFYPGMPGYNAHAQLFSNPPLHRFAFPVLPDYYTSKQMFADAYEKMHALPPTLGLPPYPHHHSLLYGLRSPVLNRDTTLERPPEEDRLSKREEELNEANQHSPVAFHPKTTPTVFLDALSTQSPEKKKERTTDTMKYQCTTCSRSYSTVSGLTKHKQFHCSQEKKEFSCKHCDKTYVSLGALKMHIRTHTLPCKCKICGKAFSRPWLLQGHVRTHTGEKPFSCVHCLRAFADRSNLRAHLQTHSEVKKYSCKTCSKTFSRMSLLLKHEDSCRQDAP